METELRKAVTELIDRYEGGECIHERLADTDVLEELEDLLDGSRGGDLAAALQRAADAFTLRRHEAARSHGRIPDGGDEFIAEVERAIGYGAEGTDDGRGIPAKGDGDGKDAEVRRRLLEIMGETGSPTYYRALGLALLAGADPWTINDADDLADRLTEVPARMKRLLLETLDGTDGLRVCSHCGRFMTEGYILGDDHACSYACALELYGGDADRMRRDIEESLAGGDADCFWTEWQ